MYLLYVDESGDPGKGKFSSPHFILSGLIVHQDSWKVYLDRLKELRKQLKNTYGLNQRTEIHASELIRINKIKAYRKITKTKRINLLRDYCTQIPIIFGDTKAIHVCLKTEEFENTGEIQKTAWNRLIQRFDNYLKKEGKDKGIIISDDTDGHLIVGLLRKMRIYNPLHSHYGEPYNAPTDNIIEDLFTRGSHHSYFIQTVDVMAHLLYRKEYPKGSLKKFGIERLFDRLDPILLKEAAKSDGQGIVRK